MIIVYTLYINLISLTGLNNYETRHFPYTASNDCHHGVYRGPGHGFDALTRAFAVPNAEPVA